MTMDGAMSALLPILREFDLPGQPLSCSCPSGGHINRTFRLHYPERDYILQRINTAVFRQPRELMRNILTVTDHLRGKILQRGGDPERETLTPVFARDGAAFLVDAEGQYWRCFLYVRDSRCYEGKVPPEQFGKCGRAFGYFLAQLADLPADTLSVTIPDFHHTCRRMLRFQEVLRQDPAGRAALVREEAEALSSRSRYAELYRRLTGPQGLPLRVVHNDAKLTNILFDAASDEPLCIIDLDTVMPGLSVCDFGDAVRFGACSSAEDEPDTDKVRFLPEQYEAYRRGFLAGCGDTLTEAEREMLPCGALLITYEQALRFLTDYLEGDVYYHTDRPGQNLDRARVQLRLLAGMEAYFPPV